LVSDERSEYLGHGEGESFYVLSVEAQAKTSRPPKIRPEGSGNVEVAVLVPGTPIR
jgi:hypothetical protein